MDFGPTKKSIRTKKKQKNGNQDGSSPTTKIQGPNLTSKKEEGPNLRTEKARQKSGKGGGNPGKLVTVLSPFPAT